MTSRQFKIAGFAAFALALLCVIYAWSAYSENAKSVRAMNENSMAVALRKTMGASELEPTMPAAGRNALYVGAGLLICGWALLLMAPKPAR